MNGDRGVTKKQRMPTNGIREGAVKVVENKLNGRTDGQTDKDKYVYKIMTDKLTIKRH